jgi:hypothetical protein
MGQYIVKIKDKFFMWSSIVDAPISAGLTEEELTEWIRQEHGRDGLHTLPERLERVRQKGTSSHMYDSAEEVIEGNHAGPNGSSLTADEIYEQYSVDNE